MNDKKFEQCFAHILLSELRDRTNENMYPKKSEANLNQREITDY
jgi:hypothetical protein